MKQHAHLRVQQTHCEAARDLALKWMGETDATQKRLAEILDVHESVLSRFLRPPELGAVHRRRRPTWMKIADRIFAHCLDSSFDFQRDELPRLSDPYDCDEHFYLNHWNRLKTARDRYEPFEGLLRIGEFVSMALHGPDPYAGRMCSNTLLVLASLLEGIVSGGMSHEFLDVCLERIDRLERMGSDYPVHPDHESLPYRVVGYASLGRGQVGLLVLDDALVERALQGLLLSATRPHEPEFGLWHNALYFLNRLLELEHPLGRPYSARASGLARDDASESLGKALRDRELRLLKREWSRCAPDVLARHHGVN